MSDTSSQDIPVFTFDGPSGVGKGTIAKLIATRSGFHLLDSGAIYRLAALDSLNKAISPEDEEALILLSQSLNIEFKPSSDMDTVHILLNGQDVTGRIRSEDIAKRASQVAVIAPVRQALLQRQRDFAQMPGLVADGRDMGTVVFPNAQAKFFLTADPQVRARRRFDELVAAGQKVDFSEIYQEIKARDERDTQRAVAPLRPADDAYLIDTSAMSIHEVETSVLQRLKELQLLP